MASSMDIMIRNRGSSRSQTAVITDQPHESGDEAAVMVDGLGATPVPELSLLYRRAHETLIERGIDVWRPDIGEYCTALDMAGVAPIRLVERICAELRESSIGAPGFEPGTSPTRTVRATRLRHAPMRWLSLAARAREAPAAPPPPPRPPCSSAPPAR